MQVSNFGSRRGRFVRSLGEGLLLVMLATATPARAQSPVLTGSWETLPYLMPINPIHCGVTHSGKVIVVAGSENDDDEHGDNISKAAVWDPTTGSIVEQDLLWDVFCNGMAALSDGRFLIVGGTAEYDPFYGDPRATIYDPATEKFNEVESMAHGRWYATVTALGDGRLMTFSGTNEDGGTNNTVEIYKVGSGWSPEYLAPWDPPLYPRLVLMPDGDIFYAGETIDSHLFHPADQTWTLNIAETNFKESRTYGSVVLLPLRPEEGYAARVMTMGGYSPATTSVEIIEPMAATPTWTYTGPMSEPRTQMNATLLPTGKVIALGGSEVNEDIYNASLDADLYDPASGTWAPAGTEEFARLYHSVSLLLPDATVWVAGGNPVRGTYEEHMEIYTPPYLFAVDPNGNVIRPRARRSRARPRKSVTGRASRSRLPMRC